MYYNFAAQIFRSKPLKHRQSKKVLIWIKVPVRTGGAEQDHFRSALDPSSVCTKYRYRSAVGTGTNRYFLASD